MKMPYRSIDFNDERKWRRKHPLDDVLQVGVQKAIGYIVNAKCTDTPTYPVDLEALKERLAKKGRLVDIMPPNESLPAEALWVGDAEMMQPILDKNSKILVDAKWPTTAKAFFNKICRTDVDHDPIPWLPNRIANKKLYHVICDLFNSWCLFCERCIWIDGKPLSEHPTVTRMSLAQRRRVLDIIRIIDEAQEREDIKPARGKELRRTLLDIVEQADLIF
jgi:hypothetical protein